MSEAEQLIAPDEETGAAWTASALTPASRSPITPAKQSSVGANIARGALALLSTQPLTWATSLLSIALVPRFLGATAYGQYTVAMTIATMVTTVAALGIPDYLVRRVARRSDSVEQEMGLALAVIVMTTLGLATVLALLIPLVGSSVADIRLLYIALVGMLATPFQSILIAWLRGRYQHKGFAWANAAGVICGGLAGVGALLLGADVVVYAAVSVVATTASTVVAFKVSGLRPSRPSVDLATVQEFVCGGFPFLSCTLTSLVASTIDRVVLGVMAPAAEVGWYAAANRVVYIPVFVPTLVATPLFAALSRGSEEPAALRRSVAESLRAVLLLTVPLSAGLIAVAPAIPSLLHWPGDFEQAIPLIQILSVSVPLMSLDMLLGTVVMALGREGAWAKLLLLSAVFNPIANAVCIPWFDHAMGDGAIGASVVTLLTELLMFGGLLILMPRHVLEAGTSWVVVRIVLAGVATALTAAALLPLALPLSVAGGTLVYVAAVFGLRVLHLDDIRQVIARRWS